MRLCCCPAHWNLVKDCQRIVQVQGHMSLRWRIERIHKVFVISPFESLCNLMVYRLKSLYNIAQHRSCFPQQFNLPETYSDTYLSTLLAHLKVFVPIGPFCP